MKRLALGLAMWIVLAGSGLIAESINFGIGTTSVPGSITFHPSRIDSDPGVVATVPGVDTLFGTGTPLNPGTLNVLGGVLTFTTGDLTGSDSLDWFFGGGGTVSLSGCVDVIGSGVCAPTDPQGTLLTGTFNSAQVTIVPGPAGTGRTYKLITSSFLDTKSRALQFLFFPSPLSLFDGTFDISFRSNGANPLNPANGLTSRQVLSGKVTNTPAVPESATLALLGTGLMALAGYVRVRGSRKCRRANEEKPSLPDQTSF